MQIQISLSSEPRYMYGLRIRPFSIGTQPNGNTDFIPHGAAPAEVKKKFEERDYRYGVLIYPNKLSARDIDHYDLTDLNEPTDAEKWNLFVEFCRQQKEYLYDFAGLVDDFLKPNSDMAHMNPLHKEKPSFVFQLLTKHGHPGNMKGLEAFYNGL